MSEQGASVGKLTVHKDSLVDREFTRIYALLGQRKLDERSMNPLTMTRAMAKHFPADTILNIERYMRGERDAKRLHLRNDKDLPTINILKLSGSTANVIQTDAGSPGAHLTAGGSWNNACTKKLKHRFRKVDREAVLEHLRRLRVREWEYRDAPDGRHFGPTAEDFYEEFELGPAEDVLNTVDLASVALIGVQSLVSRIEKLERKVARLEQKKRKRK